MPSIYLETTIPSYLAARPSRDLLIAAHQQVTRQWWETAQSQFELLISEAVLRELSAGDREVAARRVELVRELAILPMNDDVLTLTTLYADQLGLPPRARIDVLHLAYATAYNLEYLVTWNCAHMANPHVVRKLIKINDAMNRSTPLIVTPENLLESEV